jgi:hypothetical protein
MSERISNANATLGRLLSKSEALVIVAKKTKREKDEFSNKKVFREQIKL